MEKTKDEKTFSDTLGGFFEKTQKFWIVFLILLVVVSIAIGVITTISSKSKLKGANFLDSAVFNYFKSKSTLEGDEFAVCFFNKANSLARMECSVKDIVTMPFVGVDYADEYEAVELWNGDILTVRDKIETSVPPHGVKIYRVKVK